MIYRTGLIFMILILFGTKFIIAQNVNFRIYEDDLRINVPDSVKQKLKGTETQNKEVILRWLVADGYMSATIDSLGNNTARVQRGCKYDLQKIEWKLTGQRDSTTIQNPKTSYTQTYLKRAIDEKLQRLFEEGFPFASAVINKVRPDHDNCSVLVQIQLETGIEAYSSDIYFSGDYSISQEYLAKISRFQPDIKITPDYLRYLQTNLRSSELFDLVGKGQVLIENGDTVILFDLQERSLNRFNGLLGYVPDATGNGQIVGDLELFLWNVITEGNGLDLRYQRLRPETSELDLGISQDWIGGTPFGVAAGFQFYQNDTTYQSRQFEIEGTYRLAGGFKIIGGLELESTTSGSLMLNTLQPDGSKRTARLGFKYSNLDRFDVPTNGNVLSVTYGIVNKDLEVDSFNVISQNVLRLGAKQYLSVFKRSVIALSLEAFILDADQVTFNDLIRFGGANSFRGYAEDQFRAGKLLWGDLEYQFLLDSQSYLFVFGAYGTYHRPKILTEVNNDFRVTETLYSTGFGMSYQTRIGRLKFTYAISPEESFGYGKVHFGIRTEL